MRALPVGEHAVLFEVAGSAAARSLYAHLQRLRRGGPGTEPAARLLAAATDIVPGARTVLVDGLADPAALVAAAAGWTVPPTAPPPAGPPVEIGVVYDGPDLGTVAAAWRVAPEAVPGLHAGYEYAVAFLGFAPGFAYLVGSPPQLRVPRRATPRPRVPAGAVGVADAYTGVYPSPSPGGWQVIGRTAAVLWDPDRDPAALLGPGARVRFRVLG